MFYKKSFITLHVLILPGVGRGGGVRGIFCLPGLVDLHVRPIYGNLTV